MRVELHTRSELGEGVVVTALAFERAPQLDEGFDPGRTQYDGRAQ